MVGETHHPNANTPRHPRHIPVQWAKPNGAPMTNQLFYGDNLTILRCPLFGFGIRPLDIQ